MLPMVVFFPACNCSAGGDDDGLNSYCVKFYTDSGEAGSFDYDIQEVKHGGLVTRPTAPKKEGYVFSGWYKDIECTIVWKFETDKVYEDTTIFAKFSKIKE